MVDKEIYSDVKNFAYFPRRVQGDFKNLSGEDGTSFEIMQRIDVDYQAALNEESQPRILFKASDKSLMDDMNMAEKAYFISSFQTKASDERIVFFLIKNTREFDS